MGGAGGAGPGESQAGAGLTVPPPLSLIHIYVPFYVLGPTSTIDLDCPTGADIPIEERDGEEIRSLWYQEPMAPAGVRCWDPAFDVTDHSLISAIVTEGGICRPPFGESLRELVSREKGDAP